MRLTAIALVFALAVPASASTFFPVTKTCPVGGESFEHLELGSISTWGSFPDGMPLGSGVFPIALPQCPGNGMVLYKDFDAVSTKQLEPVVLSERYRAMRTREMPYYLAYHLATALNDGEHAPWLLLSATWQAKGLGAIDARAARYMEEFVALVGARKIDASDLISIALRARAANALRELGRFAEAETLRASIVISSTAGGSDDNAKKNRQGWAEFLAVLESAIKRGDATRAPIDMLSQQEAARRCVAPERKLLRGETVAAPPLTPFETTYCQRPEFGKHIADVRKWMNN